MLRRILRILLWFVAGLTVIIIGLVFYVRAVSVTEPPELPAYESFNLQVTEPDSGLQKVGRNWFRKSESGLYELYVEGSPYERGIVNGLLTRDLVRYQEEVFNTQIHQLVPSEYYLHVLKYFVGFFNRNIDEHVPEEYLHEIYGVSQSASDQFNDIAQPYQRILNYHGAHDIGHALQNMSLVGCTAFATWGASSEDGSLIIGRNFDFYVGDDFARDKIVAFYRPEKGHRFMMVTFGGMTGVLSGMNVEGLTVTINAAKSNIPGSAATPVSLVAREILQYASTIEEAYAIAEKRKMFVAESFLIGSAKEGKAVIIEKDTETQATYATDSTAIVLTNHFQSEKLGSTELNREHMRTSASPYRYARVKELLRSAGKNSIEKTAAILRDQKGLGGKDLGMGNEKLINQLVAHHGIIFQPEKLLVWVSTAPWQLGKFACYDLNKVFALDPMQNAEIYDADKVIPADSFIFTKQYRDYVKFSRYRFPFNPREDLHPDSVVKWNPSSYHAYLLAGDKLLDAGEIEKAKLMYERGLALETGTVHEREHMEDNLKLCNERMP
jgi:isopenicillin-N N-acyltransferase like protein